MSETLRNQLVSYELGSINNCELLSVKELRIGVFGQTGAGKSAFICSCERALYKKDKGSAPLQTKSGEGTVLLEDYLTGAKGFRLVDTRGYFSYSHDEMKEFTAIMKGDVKSGQHLQRNNNVTYQSTEPSVQHKVHGAIVVLKADDPHLLNDNYTYYYDFLRNYFSSQGITPITVITHKDQVDNSKLAKAISLAKKVTLSADQNIFCIKNYTNETRPVEEIDKQVLQVLLNAIRAAELFVKNEQITQLMANLFK